MTNQDNEVIEQIPLNPKDWAIIRNLHSFIDGIATIASCDLKSLLGLRLRLSTLLAEMFWLRKHCRKSRFNSREL